MDSVIFARFPTVEESLKNRVPLKEWKCHDSKDYEKIRQIGKGTFSDVYKAIYKKETKEQRIVALKKLSIFEDRGFDITSLREILIMKRLNHKNILKLEEILYTQPNDKNKKRGNVYLVFPYMPQDLSIVRSKEHLFNLSHIKYIFYQVLSGINYLHRCKIIHRDIKCSNILMNQKGEICIGDFGLARKDSQEHDKRYTSTVVTLSYRAPELLLGSRAYGTAVDMWSAGCVFAEILTANILFSGCVTDKEQINKILSYCGTPDEKTWPEFDKLPRYKELITQKTQYPNTLREHFKNNKYIDDTTFDLVNRLLDLNPKTRITSEQALNHEFFKKEPKMCSPEELPDMEEFHEFQSLKEKKEQTNRLSELKDKKNMEIGNKDYLGKKRNEPNLEDNQMKSGAKLKQE